MNQDEFVILIEEHKNIIYKICNSYCKHKDRKDLEQEILLHLWKSMDAYDGRVKVTTWFYKVALNTAISYYRKLLMLKKRKAIIPHLGLFNQADYDFEKDEQIKLMYRFIKDLKPFKIEICILI